MSQAAGRLLIHLMSQAPARLLIHLMSQSPARLLIHLMSQSPVRPLIHLMSSSSQMAIHDQVRGSLSRPVISHETMSNTIVSINTLAIKDGLLFSWRGREYEKCSSPNFFMHLALYKYCFNHVLRQKTGFLFAPINHYLI